MNDIIWCIVEFCVKNYFKKFHRKCSSVFKKMGLRVALRIRNVGFEIWLQVEVNQLRVENACNKFWYFFETAWKKFKNQNDRFHFFIPLYPDILDLFVPPDIASINDTYSPIDQACNSYGLKVISTIPLKKCIMILKELLSGAWGVWLILTTKCHYFVAR